MDVPRVGRNSHKKNSTKATVQYATEKKQTSSDKPAPAPKADIAAPKVMLFDIRSYDKDKIALAESAGIPIRKIAETMNNFANYVQKRLDEHDNAFKTVVSHIQNDLPKNISEQLMKQIEAAKQGAMPASAAETSPLSPTSNGGGAGGLNLGTVMNLIDKVAGGGGGNDAMTQYFINRGMQNADFGDFLTREILRKSVPDIVGAYEAQAANALKAAQAAKPQ